MAALIIDLILDAISVSELLMVYFLISIFCWGPQPVKSSISSVNYDNSPVYRRARSAVDFKPIISHDQILLGHYLLIKDFLK